jgi:hypothetical protein
VPGGPGQVVAVAVEGDHGAAALEQQLGGDPADPEAVPVTRVTDP